MLCFKQHIFILNDLQQSSFVFFLSNIYCCNYWASLH